MRQPFRRFALAIAGFALVATQAAAEDFSGFYAGVNAGYAFGSSARDGGSATAFPPSARDETRDLPPSAAASSLATRRDRAGDAGARPR